MFLFATSFLRAQEVQTYQGMQLYQQFYGKYDYTAIGNTLNLIENNPIDPGLSPGADPPGPPECTILEQSSATLNMTSTQTVVAAYLYWAGVGYLDPAVKLNNIPIIADRVFFKNFFWDQKAYPMFAAFADVTNLVNQFGNSDYVFSDLNLSMALPPYCERFVNFGGWAIIIVYEDVFNVNSLVNIYDGFEDISGGNPVLQMTLENLEVINPLQGKVGFLAWEGDSDIAVNESFKVNGNIINNLPLNPGYNIFNGTNSFTGADDMYNMDLDIFDISSFISTGDTELDIEITSGQDFVLMNNIVLVLNNEIPDATIIIHPISNGDSSCFNREVTIYYTVSNLNSTGALPANIPVAFYINETLVTTSYTNQNLEIGESITQSVTFNVPHTVSNEFELVAVVDDFGDGTGIQQEIDENNNSFSLHISLSEVLEFAIINDIIMCDNDDSNVSFNLLNAVSEINPEYTFTFHYTETEALGGINHIQNFINYQGSEEVYIRIQNAAGCYYISKFSLITRTLPVINTPTKLYSCVQEGGATAEFDLSLKNEEISLEEGVIITYHSSLEQALNGINPLGIPYVGFKGELLFVRVENIYGCTNITTLELGVIDNLLFSNLLPIILCDDSTDGVVNYDLNMSIPNILTNAVDPNNTTIEFFTQYSDAVNGNQLEMITNLTDFSISSSELSIGIRITDNFTGCQSYATLDFKIVAIPDLPETVIQPIVVCQQNNSINIKGEFNLTIYESVINDSDNELLITYHLTETDADLGINKIINPKLYVSESRTVYIKVSYPYAQANCSDYFALDLVVVPLPYVVNSTYSICEVNSTGFAQFNLYEFSSAMLGSNQPEENFTVTYHLTIEDAVEETNVLGNIYTNITQTHQIIGVKIIDNNTGCIRYDQINLYAEEAAIANDIGSSIIHYCDDFDGVNDGFISGVNLTIYENDILRTQNPNQFVLTYYLSEIDANQSSNPIDTPNNFTNTEQGGQIIYVRVENSFTNAPCHDVTSIQLVVEQPPVIIISSPKNILCIEWGDTIASQEVLLTTGITEIGYVFQWYYEGNVILGANDSELVLNKIDEKGKYSVVVTSPTGCVSERSEEFEVLLSSPPVFVDYITSSAFDDQQNIVVNVIGYGDYVFQLNDGHIQPTGYFTNVPSGYHTVTVYDMTSGDINKINSCGNLIIDHIQLISYPKFFTPNGDGYNDVWRIMGLTRFHEPEIFIFDRYGKILKQITRLGDGWDGTYKGKPLPATDYWFKILYNEKDINGVIQRKMFTAHFSLKR